MNLNTGLLIESDSVYYGLGVSKIGSRSLGVL